ncbi:hypothetical protein B0H11DRAFT_1905382 [Mycena galericulata]|nr:hypothetical protein B0H11DRAFT_1905382 [Mycena galericulata]
MFLYSLFFLAKMLARTLLLPILFFSTSTPLKKKIVVIAASGRFHAVLRQTDSDCANECTAYNNDPGVCNNTIVNDAATCLNCEIKAGLVTPEDAQDALNEVVQDCIADDTPVTSIVLSGNSPTGAGSAPPLSTPTPASPTHTTKPAENPSTTEPANEQPTTNSAGDPISASGNSTDSVSAAPAASTGAAMKTQSAVGMSSVLTILSVFVTLG